jgi:hypothetical protein
VNIYPFREAEKAGRHNVKGREGVLDQVPLAGEPRAADHQLGSGRHGDHIGHGHEVLACSSVGAAGSRGVLAVAGGLLAGAVVDPDQLVNVAGEAVRGVEQRYQAGGWELVA